MRLNGHPARSRGGEPDLAQPGARARVEQAQVVAGLGELHRHALQHPRELHEGTGILRRLDDDYCDPLELRDDSTLGVAGLSEVVRRGNVLLANGLGSSLLESGALLGLIPMLRNTLIAVSRSARVNCAN